MAESEFTTGSTLLPDIGTLNYNGCTFSPLFESSLSGNAVKDEANRTVKYTEIVLTVDGYVTLGIRLSNDISATMATMHRLLTAQAGALEYRGRGFDIVVNASAGAGIDLGKIRVNRDVAWGPVPELLEFQPLGGGLSAKVRWKCTVRVPAIPPGRGFAGLSSVAPLLQFNFETSVSYNEDGFSAMSVHGSLEIPLTRRAQGDRKVPITADDYRPVIQRHVLKGIDLSRFRVTRRNFDTSRDKRTLTWEFAVDEKPYMDLPPSCPIARGSYNVRPARAGPGLCLWLCTLQATYTIRADVSRRQAYLLFLALLRLRMAESRNKDNIPDLKDGDQDGSYIPPPPSFTVLGNLYRILKIKLFAPSPAKKEVEDVRKPILIDFSFNEGLYLDSKTVSFSATWRMCSIFSHILLASGLWKKIKEVDNAGDNLWAISMRDISGTNSWLSNQLDPSLDVIVDFGATE